MPHASLHPPPCTCFPASRLPAHDRNPSVGLDPRFPVMIVSPQLKTFEAPEGGYKFIYKGEEKDADEYIRTEELKMAEKANEQRETVMVEQDPLFGPRSPLPPQTPPPADEDSN